MSKAAAVPVMSDPAVLEQVLVWLNGREFARYQPGRGLQETLFVHHGRIRAHYASFELDSLFQPVFDFQHRRYLGHEALLAGISSGSLASLGNVLSPQRVFTLASNEDITFVDRLARTLHALNFLLQGSPGLLHLNVHPHHLLAVSVDHGRVFEGILRQCGLDTGQIVLEIPEYAVPQKKRLAEAINAWQQKGYRIAIDNVGRDAVHTSQLRKLKPYYIKVDRLLLRAALDDGRKRKQLLRLAHGVMDDGILVIGTGVENHRQLDLLHESGINIAQGYIFGRPQPYCLPV